MVGQAQVVVGPQHDPLLTVNDDNGVLRFGYRVEVRIEADRLQLARFGELPALFEQRDLLKLLCVHDASARSGGQEIPNHYVAERLKLVLCRKWHKLEKIPPHSSHRRTVSKACAVGSGRKPV
jgi:hypothetical protein